MYIAGGRAYFEADVFATDISSFTTKGFFDKLGYVEPTAKNSSNLTLILAITIPLGVLLIGAIVFLYCCYTKKNKKNMHTD